MKNKTEQELKDIIDRSDKDSLRAQYELIKRNKFNVKTDVQE